jgi:3-phosphoshikimate 1-carboxyvinyltransferase
VPSFRSADSPPWPAPLARAPVTGTVTLPGSKSLTNRELVLSALADGPSLLRRPLRARDTTLMAGALQALGSEVADAGADWRVTPHHLSGPADIDCGLAGTVMRFLPPVAALATGKIRFDGDPQARRRPVSALIAALAALGVEVAVDGTAEGEGGLPFTVVGSGTVRGGPVSVDASASSQLVSGLLLAGARYQGGIEVRHHGPRLPSLPHIAMTVDRLRCRGVSVDDSLPERWVVHPGVICAADVDIEPDLSTAAAFLAAALVTGGRVTVADWPPHSRQPGAELPAILVAMGARADRDGEGLTVTGDGAFAGADLDLHDVGELAPVLAAVCVLARTPSRLRGIAHLRGHESDRLAALATELNRLGGDVATTPDGLVITPRPLTGTLFHTYADHRLAQAAAVIGLRVPGTTLDDVGCTDKTHPDFVGAWTALLR